MRVTALIFCIACEIAILAGCLAGQGQSQRNGIHLTFLGRYHFSGAEISAYDPGSKRLFVTSSGTSMGVLDLSDAAHPGLVVTLPFHATSVTVKNGQVAIAVPAASGGATNGEVYLYESKSAFDRPVRVAVGAGPDMLTFTDDGQRIVVANEGERAEDADPEGSISIIDLGHGIADARERKATFTGFNSLREKLVEQGVRIFPDAASVAQDLEPEYIAVSSAGDRAWVTLQENNSIAVVDLAAGTIEQILPFGYKDHNRPGNGLDASDKDHAIHIANWPVLGMYLPDEISTFEVNGKTYLVTANEGDARAGEEVRVGDLTLDPSAFANAAALQDPANLGRLIVTSVNGDTDGDGDYDRLYSFGARSFSVWSADGKLVFDSGDAFEQITAKDVPALFNADEGDPSKFDTRSDRKGPEPEGVTVAVINDIPYAFIGLERAGGGVMVYDLRDPAHPAFVEYARSDEDVAPEGLLFIPAADSPAGAPLLVVTNETSGTVTIYQL